jgi:hypothetical protein
MQTKHIDILNIVLLLISLVLSFKLPFELFLFSYAVLGPLHYLTEINWLKDKNYFIADKKWALIFTVFAITMSFILLAIQVSLSKFLADIVSLKSINHQILFLYNLIIFSLVVFAISLMYFKKTADIIAFIFFGVLIGFMSLRYLPFTAFIIGSFLPTIIHVYLFTLFFMIFGTMNKSSLAGKIAIIVLILAPFVIFGVNIDLTPSKSAIAAQEILQGTNFYTINLKMVSLVDFVASHFSFITAQTELKVQTFIAFCYTYHYLNWFSKTSIIGWHKTFSKPKLLIILIIWLSMVGIYYYDYVIGLLVLFILSMLHVFLEFPLNILTVKTILLRRK